MGAESQQTMKLDNTDRPKGLRSGVATDSSESELDASEALANVYALILGRRTARMSSEKMEPSDHTAKKRVIDGEKVCHE